MPFPITFPGLKTTVFPNISISICCHHFTSLLSVVYLHEAHLWTVVFDVSHTICFHPPCTSRPSFVFPCTDSITTQCYLVSFNLMQAGLPLTETSCGCHHRPEICCICLLVITSPTAGSVHTTWQYLSCYQNTRQLTHSWQWFTRWCQIFGGKLYLWSLIEREWETRRQTLSGVSIIVPYYRHYNYILVWATHSLSCFYFTWRNWVNNWKLNNRMNARS